MREGLTILALFFNSGVLSALTQNETENSAFFLNFEIFALFCPEDSTWAHMNRQKRFFELFHFREDGVFWLDSQHYVNCQTVKEFIYVVLQYNLLREIFHRTRGQAEKVSIENTWGECFIIWPLFGLSRSPPLPPSVYFEIFLKLYNSLKILLFLCTAVHVIVIFQPRFLSVTLSFYLMAFPWQDGRPLKK